jgi:hypothetical protein
VERPSAGERDRYSAGRARDENKRMSMAINVRYITTVRETLR